MTGDRPATFDVPLSVPFRHRVTFTRGALDHGNAALRQAMTDGSGKRARAVAFVDEGVARSTPGFADALRSHFSSAPGMPSLEAIELIPGGERCKQSMETVDRVVAAVDAHRIDRQSFVLAVGGGAVLDAVGFGAAIAHRGVRLVRMPTTTLSQDDE
jgi:3-dehydroquinate synthase